MTPHDTQAVSLFAAAVVIAVLIAVVISQQRKNKQQAVAAASRGHGKGKGAKAAAAPASAGNDTSATEPTDGWASATPKEVLSAGVLTGLALAFAAATGMWLPVLLLLAAGAIALRSKRARDGLRGALQKNRGGWTFGLLGLLRRLGGLLRRLGKWLKGLARRLRRRTGGPQPQNGPTSNPNPQSPNDPGNDPGGPTSEGVFMAQMPDIETGYVEDILRGIAIVKRHIESDMEEIGGHLRGDSIKLAAIADALASARFEKGCVELLESTANQTAEQVKRYLAAEQAKLNTLTQLERRIRDVYAHILASSVGSRPERAA